MPGSSRNGPPPARGSSADVVERLPGTRRRFAAFWTGRSRASAGARVLRSVPDDGFLRERVLVGGSAVIRLVAVVVRIGKAQGAGGAVSTVVGEALRETGAGSSHAVSRGKG